MSPSPQTFESEGKPVFSMRCRWFGFILVGALLACSSASNVSSASKAEASVDASGDWPQWRGPLFNGSNPEAHDLPVEWSETKNVLWRAELPNWSAATPIIWEDTVFVTSPEEGWDRNSNEKDKLLLIAVNRGDGSIRWMQDAGSGNRLYRKQNLSSPSPVTDGEQVWVLTGSGQLSCFDFEGERVWTRNIQEDYGRFGLNHGYASSPRLDGDRLYIQVLHGMKTDEPSYVFAVDKMSGETIWKVNRPTDAPKESPDDYSTPLIANVDGERQLIVSGGDYVTGHDLESGKELWRMGGFNPNKDPFYRTIASSVLADGVVYTTSTRGRPFIAFRPGGEGKLSDSNIVWKNDMGSDVPTPAADGERIYVLKDNGVMTALDAKTGEPVWGPERIEPGTYSASPLLADGKIYAINEDGTTTVLKAGAGFEVLAVNKLDGFTLASPSAAGNQLFLRTGNSLYCLVKQ